MPSATRDLEASTSTDDKEPLQNVREIHQKALDDLVNVNSLFTLAVFVGLSMARQGERSLENRTECDADVGNAKRLVVNEVVSFACFLLSSLVAKALKIHVTICQEEDFKNPCNKVVRFSMLMLSVWASVFGCIFLTVSMVDVIQIKVGRLSCRSLHAWRAAGALIAIVLLALSIYVPFMMTAIFTSVKKVQGEKAEKEKEDKEEVVVDEKEEGLDGENEEKGEMEGDADVDDNKDSVNCNVIIP